MFRHPRRVEHSKSFIFDAVVGLGGAQSGDALVLLLKYFNQYDYAFTDGSYYLIHANVAKTIGGIETHYTEAVAQVDRLRVEEFDLMGDIVWLTPLPDALSPRHGPVLYAAGAASNVDKTRSQFDIDADHYISFVKVTGTPPPVRNNNAVLSLHATIQDSPRWKNAKDGKPMPVNGKYVHVQGLLTRVKRVTEKDESGREFEVAKAFAMDIETIAFLGNAAAKVVAAPPVAELPSTDTPVSARKCLKLLHTDSKSGGSSPLKRKSSTIFDPSTLQSA
ncbi:hypothetical protein BKA93DRAFT_753070 [Sparassis latifolia]